jgi:predicted  nucleic acid-binding Zn-ribbon protein
MSIFANVYLGNTANDGTGDTLRTAFRKIDQNFANIATITSQTAGVTTVAGRSGNVLLSINDVSGAVGIGTLNSALAASNVYLTNTLNTFTGTASQTIYNQVVANVGVDIAVQAGLIAQTGLAPLTTFEANLGVTNTRLNVLNANVGTLTNTVTSIINTTNILTANAGVQAASINLLTGNAATQNNSIVGLNANVTAANLLIATLDSNVGTVNLSVQSLTSNAATQATALRTIDANLGIASTNIGGLQSTAATQATEISGLRANITAANAAVALAGYATKTQLTNNIAIVNSSISALSSNVGTLSIRAGLQDANLGTATTNITTLFANAGSQAGTLSSINLLIGTLSDSVVTALNRTTTLDANVGSIRSNLTQTQANVTINSNQIFAINSNVTAANARIQTIDGNLGAVSNYIGTINSQILAINAAIVASNTAVTNSTTAKINSTNANVTAANLSIAALTTAVNSNAATQATEISGLRANVTAANVNITSLSANAAAANVQINLTQSNLTALTTNFNSLTANVNSSQVTVTGNVYANKYFYGNGMPFVGQAATGNITFSGFTVNAPGGELNINSYTGINNNNPGYWLHVGNVNTTTRNAGNIALEYFANSVNKGSAVWDWDYWTGTVGNGNDGTIHSRIGLFKNGNISTPLMVSDYISGNISFPYFVIAPNVSTGLMEAGNVSTNSMLVYTNANISGNLYIGGSPGSGIFWANGASYSTGAGGGGTYSNIQVAQYLPTYTGNLAAGNITVATGVFWSNGTSATYSNSSVATYLPIYSGNLNINLLGAIAGSFGNITSPGSATFGRVLSDNYTYANGTSILTGLYSNANVASYFTTNLPTFNGNVNGLNFTGGGIDISGQIRTTGFAFISGNVTAANLNVGNVYGTGRITTTGSGGFGSVITSGNIQANTAIISVGNVYTNGNIAMVSSVPRNVYVNTVAPLSTQGNVGDIWYQTY